MERFFQFIIDNNNNNKTGSEATPMLEQPDHRLDTDSYQSNIPDSPWHKDNQYNTNSHRAILND